MGSYVIQKTFHTCAVFWYLIVDIYACYIAVILVCTKWNIVCQQFGCGAQYISVWNMVAQELYFLASFWNDFSNDKCKARHKKMLMYAFQTIVYPLTLLVSTYFWCFYTIEPGLLDEFNIMKETLSTAIHPAHTINLLLAIFESVVSSDNRINVSKKQILASSIAIQLIYSLVVYIFFALGNVWPYPILKNMPYLLLLTLGICNSTICLAIQITISNFSAYLNPYFKNLEDLTNKCLEHTKVLVMQNYNIKLKRVCSRGKSLLSILSNK